jgi:hypothetical protein
MAQWRCLAKNTAARAHIEIPDQRGRVSPNFAAAHNWTITPKLAPFYITISPAWLLAIAVRSRVLG